MQEQASRKEKRRYAHAPLYGSIVIAAIIMCSCGTPKDEPVTPVNKAAAVSISESANQISQQRNLAVSRVKKAKKKLPEEKQTFTRAQNLYVDAQGKFNALLDEVLISVDTSVPLNDSANFKTRAAEASQAMGAFIFYVDEHADMGVGVLETQVVKEVVSGLLAGGGDIWKKYQEEKRANAAQQFDQTLTLKKELKKTLETLRLPDFDEVK